MKPRIHFHSDCSFFAGCENMLVNFFNDNYFIANFNVSFSYRYSTAYQSGFSNRVYHELHTIPLKLFDINNLYFYINKLFPRPISLLIILLINILLIKYFFILCNTLILYKLFKKEHIDILHINNGGYPAAYSCMSAVFAARLRGIKRIVYVVNNVATPYKLPIRWLDLPLDKIVGNSVSVFVTGSIYAGKELKNVLKLPSSKVINIHNGINIRPVTEPKKEVLKRLGIENDHLLIAVVAVLEKRKGHIYLLKALKLLKEQGYTNKLPMVLIEGTGSNFPSLKRFVDDAGLNGYVRFIGVEANVFNLMNAVEVIILPSISYEDFPNVTLEAMSLGKTVIASRLAGIPEQIQHMDSGILFAPGDVIGLAEAIMQVMENPILRNLLGINATRRFAGEFPANLAVTKYVKLYNNILKNNTPGQVTSISTS